MCWYIICHNREYFARSSITNEVREQMDKFTKNLESKIGSSFILTFDIVDQGNIDYTFFGKK